MMDSFNSLNERYAIVLDFISKGYKEFEKDGMWVDLNEEKELIVSELEYYYKDMEGSVIA